jgi:hypothetical protein
LVHIRTTQRYVPEDGNFQGEGALNKIFCSLVLRRRRGGGGDDDYHHHHDKSAARVYLNILDHHHHHHHDKSAAAVYLNSLWLTCYGSTHWPRYTPHKHYFSASGTHF